MWKPVTICLLLAACSDPTFVWSKRGANPSDHDQDAALCRNEAYLSAAASRIPAVEYFRNCMIGRGWTLAEVR